MRVRALVPFTILALFASLAHAQETPVPEPTKEELPVLRAELERTVQAQIALESGDPKTAGDLLGTALPTPPDEWKTAVANRVAALTSLVAALDEKSNGKTLDQIEEEIRRTASDLAALPAPGPVAANAESTESPVLLQAELTAAEADAQRAQGLIEARTLKIRSLTAQIPFDVKIREVRDRLDEAGATNGDALGAWRRRTAEIELRALTTWRDLAPDALKRWSRLLALRQDELELARTRVSDLKARLDAALRSEWNRAKEMQRAAEERAVAAEAARGAAKGQPIRAFELGVRARMAKSEAAEATAKIDLLGRIGPLIREQGQENEDLKTSWQALRDRFAPDRGVSSRTPQLLLTSRKRVERSRTQLERTLVPELTDELSSYAKRRADVQDQLLELTMKPEDGPPDYLLLLRDLPTERHDEAREAWIRSMQKGKPALEALDAQLGQVILALEKLGSIYDTRRSLLEEMNAFIVTRIYWVRNEEPVGLATLVGVRDEIKQIALAYTGAPLRKGLLRSFREGRLRVAILFLLFVGLVVLGAWIIRRLRSYRKRWDYKGGPAFAAFQRVLVTLLLAALAPAVWAAAALLLGILDLPPLLVVPGRIVLFGIAIASFARRFLWNFFREDEGIAVKEFRTPPEVATQLYRASSFAVFGFVSFVLPWWILSHTPLVPGLEHLPRIFWTAMLAFYGYVLLSLLRRRGALMAALTRHRGFWYRALFFLEPILLLGFAGIVAMDLMGYRIGAALLTGNVVQTFLWGLVLIGLYNLLTSTVQHAANRVRQQKRLEVSAKEAFEKGREVFEQLSRFAGVTMLVVAVVILGRFWGLGDSLQAFFDSFSVPKFPHVTLWDVLVALVWIGAGHFVIRHLQALYEVLLFPRMEKAEAGTRYVIVAVSKYVVFLFAYSSALLSLRFSFTSLGVVLAAVSVGIGFGLQEIVANFVSGLILFFERPVRVGDIVTVGTTVGTVERINIRATQVTNFDRQVMIIPNRQFIVEQVTNWTHNDLVVRGAVEVGVAYGTPVEKVGRILLEIVKAHPKVKRDPEPRFLFLGFGDSSLNLRVWVFTDIEYRVQTVSELHIEVARRFAEEGIEIPFPQRDLHLRSADATFLEALARGAPRLDAPD